MGSASDALKEFKERHYSDYHPGALGSTQESKLPYYDRISKDAIDQTAFDEKDRFLETGIPSFD